MYYIYTPTSTEFSAAIQYYIVTQYYHESAEDCLLHGN